MNQTSIPKFTSVVSSQQWPPPYTFSDVNFSVFIVQADITAQQRYCRDLLNAQPGQNRPFVFEPLMPFAFVIWAQYGAMRAVGHDDDQDVGYLPQHEIMVTFPVMRFGSRLGNLLLDAAINWAFPYIAVNKVTSVIAGREVLGFDKLFGLFKAHHNDATGTDTLEYSQAGFKQEGFNRPEVPFPVLKIHGGMPSAATSDPRHIFPWSNFVPSFIENKIDPWVSSILRNSVAGTLPVMNFQQFRDGADPDLSYYQSLTSCRMRFDNLNGLPQFWDQSKIEIFPVESLTDSYTGIQLGVGNSSGNPRTIHPFLAVTFNCDMSMHTVGRPYIVPIHGDTTTPVSPLEWLLARVKAMCGLRQTAIPPQRGPLKETNNGNFCR
jgi:hypothetical protein